MRMIVAFEKTPRVRHIGHLDLMRAMQRALRRSGLPIRYSQGFHPHVVLSFASPLPVGYSGGEELMDIALREGCSQADEAEFARLLARALPPAFPLLRVRAVEDRHPKLMASLATAAYDVFLPAYGGAQALQEAIPTMLAQDEIIAIRKTKSKEQACNIRPMIHELSAAPSEAGLHVYMRVSLTERETLKPSLLIEELTRAACPVLGALYHRVRLYGERDGQAVSLMEL